MSLTLSLPLVLALFPLVTLSSLHSHLQGLKMVHLVFRHGDRTPVDPYPNDPYKDRKFWPVGFGQLTPGGKMRHFELGQWLRERYSGYLSKDYDEEEVYVRSTDVDRTLMSAQANLAGLYPPTPSQRWNKDLAWQPIPVHTVKESEDFLLSSHADCPRFTRLQKELLRSQEFRDIYETNRDLFEHVSRNTGKNITDIVELDYVYDTLSIEAQNNLSLPDWTSGYFPGGKFKELSDMSFWVDTWTHELKRLKGGPFVKEMLKHHSQVLDGTMTPAKRKLFMYSGHDTTVAPILHALDLFHPPIAPVFAACILFELLDRDGPVLRISYRNESSREPYILTVPGCSELCPLNRFKELTASIIPADLQAECGVGSGEEEEAGGIPLLEQRVTFIAAVSSSMMAVVVLLSVVALICCRRKNDLSGKYERIGEDGE